MDQADKESKSCFPVGRDFKFWVKAFVPNGGGYIFMGFYTIRILSKLATQL